MGEDSKKYDAMETEVFFIILLQNFFPMNFKEKKIHFETNEKRQFKSLKNEKNYSFIIS